jgi:hypothetical protein
MKPKPDSVSTSKTELLVFSAEHLTASARLEEQTFGSVVIHIHDHTQKLQMRIDWATGICLREIFNNWFNDRYRDQK